MNYKTVILGAGIAGLGASHALKQRGENPIILEKCDTFGGLAGCFTINGFRFDRFVHFSFASDKRVNDIFLRNKYLTHTPNPSNIYKRIWIKHPAQNNIFPLAADEKERIIADFKKRKPIGGESPQNVPNYEAWLRCQFGDYFAEHFPMAYTRKYWMREARDLRTEWVGNRLYQPSIEEVIAGSVKEDARVTYYAKEMRYPQKGGFCAFFNSLADEATIAYGTKIIAINPAEKTLRDTRGNTYKFDRLISSLPLPLIVGMLPDVPDVVAKAAKKLDYTSGYHVSVGLKTKNIPDYLWWYIYDEDILAARVYSPSLKSPDNAPEGCSSLQFEVYCKKDQYNNQELIDGTVGKMVEMGVIRQEDILFTHVGFEEYANVIFTEPVYESRETVRHYLNSIGIETIGRFGLWDYLWSDQSLISGFEIN